MTQSHHSVCGICKQEISPDPYGIKRVQMRKNKGRVILWRSLGGINDNLRSYENASRSLECR